MPAPPEDADGDAREHQINNCFVVVADIGGIGMLPGSESGSGAAGLPQGMAEFLARGPFGMGQEGMPPPFVFGTFLGGTDGGAGDAGLVQSGSGDQPTSRPPPLPSSGGPSGEEAAPRFLPPPASANVGAVMDGSRPDEAPTSATVSFLYCCAASSPCRGGCAASCCLFVFYVALTLILLCASGGRPCAPTAAGFGSPRASLSWRRVSIASTGRDAAHPIPACWLCDQCPESEQGEAGCCTG